MKLLTTETTLGWVLKACSCQKCLGSPEYCQPTGVAKATKLVEMLNPLVSVQFTVRVGKPVFFFCFLLQRDVTESDLWKTNYIHGANLEMYTETLSISFKGMGYQQVAE